MKATHPFADTLTLALGRSLGNTAGERVVSSERRRGWPGLRYGLVCARAGWAKVDPAHHDQPSRGRRQGG